MIKFRITLQENLGYKRQDLCAFPISGHEGKVCLSCGFQVSQGVILCYCASHVPVQLHFRRYYFYFLPDQAQIHIDHWKVLDELWC